MCTRQTDDNVRRKNLFLFLWSVLTLRNKNKHEIVKSGGGNDGKRQGKRDKKRHSHELKQKQRQKAASSKGSKDEILSGLYLLVECVLFINFFHSPRAIHSDCILLSLFTMPFHAVHYVTRDVFYVQAKTKNYRKKFVSEHKLRTGKKSQNKFFILFIIVFTAASLAEPRSAWTNKRIENLSLKRTFSYFI